ncbi:MAG: GT4 family glycosyltransferase PelF [Chitinophagales bacterium]
MKICLITEGSYPYVMGGVSSWIQMLISSMPQHEFLIYTIGAEEKYRGVFKYDLPDNITAVVENFFDEYKTQKYRWGRRYRIGSVVTDEIIHLILGDKVVWEPIFEFLSDSKFNNISSFLMSFDFLDLVQKVSKEHFAYIPFTEFFWTIRSMLLPLFHIISKGIPPADLYHSVSTGYAGVMGGLAKYTYRKPFIVTEHGIYSREREEEIIKAMWLKSYFKDTYIRFFYNLSNSAYSSADKVIALFHRNQEIQQELGCSVDKISVIPNGIDVSLYENLPGKEEDDNYINLGALIRIVPIKDVKTMIHAFVLAKKEIKSLRLFIMGSTDEDPDYYNECLQLVERLQLKDVIFTGRINARDYIGKMDLIILSSISEGQPLALLEAMATRKPCICTDVGCCRELIEGDGGNPGGIVVPVMDYEIMGQAIIKLGRDKELRKQMGEIGFERVNRFYTAERFISNYRDLYSSFEVV